MSAIAVYNDHLKLANIGTMSHTQLEAQDAAIIAHIPGIGNYAFPAADGTINQIIETDGAGALSWVNKPASFACADLNSCDLTDIGTRAHSSLTGIGTSDHHVKFTDQNAVDACKASNDFIERGVVNSVTAITEIEQTINDSILQLHIKRASNMFTIGPESFLLESTNTSTLGMTISLPAFNLTYKGTDAEKVVGRINTVKLGGSYKGYMQFYVANSAGGLSELIRLAEDSMDIKNLPIKDIKNHAHSALSGTKKLIEILIGTTSYYWEVYPTKA